MAPKLRNSRNFWRKNGKIAEILEKKRRKTCVNFFSLTSFPLLFFFALSFQNQLLLFNPKFNRSRNSSMFKIIFLARSRHSCVFWSSWESNSVLAAERDPSPSSSCVFWGTKLVISRISTRRATSAKSKVLIVSSELSQFTHAITSICDFMLFINIFVRTEFLNGMWACFFSSL